MSMIGIVPLKYSIRIVGSMEVCVCVIERSVGGRREKRGGGKGVEMSRGIAIVPCAHAKDEGRLSPHGVRYRPCQVSVLDDNQLQRCRMNIIIPVACMGAD